MRSPLSGLVRLSLRATFGPKPLGDIVAGGPKSILKAAGVGLLMVFVAADVGLLFAATNFAIYDALAPAGLQGLLLLNAATNASLVVFTLGFVTALSTYIAASRAEAGLLALPFRPRDLLAARMAVVYGTEALLGAFLVGIAAVIYGVKEGPPADFYLLALLTALSLPLLPLALVYALLVPLMSLGRVFRSRNAAMLLAGAVGLVAAMGFNLYSQGIVTRLSDPGWILEHFAGPRAFLARAGRTWPPSLLAWKALSGAGGAAGIAYALANLALGLAAVAAVAFGLGKPYAASVLGFGEGNLRRIARGEAAAWIARSFRRRPLILSLLLREWRLMNREPSYFLNGPLVVILMPVLLGVMALVQREALTELGGIAKVVAGGPYGMLIAAALGTFLGTTTSITCTAVSRDAKFIPSIKALPVPVGSWLLAKLLHGLVFALVGAVTGAVGLGFVLGLDAPRVAGAFVIALGMSGLVNVAGLLLDLANPLLRWDNPLAALKKNVNAVIVILGNFGLMAGLGFLATRLPFAAGGFVLLYGLLPAALGAGLLALARGWAVRRVGKLEA